MAVPTNARILRGTPLKSGVILGVSPSSDPTFDVEIARATSSGVYDSVGRLTPKGGGVPVSFTDLLPLDNATRYYKARAVKDGWDPGDYTSPVSGKPVPLPEIAPNITPLTGKGIGVPLFISTGSPPQVGQAAAQANVRKYLNMPPETFRSITAADLLAYDNVVLYGSVANATYLFNGSAVLPPGVTVRSVELFTYIGTTGATSTSGDTVGMSFTKTNIVTASGSLPFASLAVTSTFGAGAQSDSTTMSLTFSSNEVVYITGTVRTANLVAGLRGGVAGARIGYDMPTYDKAV